MSDEQEIEVKVDDAGELTAPAVETEGRADQPVAVETKPDNDPIAELERQYKERVEQDQARILQAEKAARDASERERKAVEEATEAKGYAATTEYHSVVNAIAAEQTTLDAAKRDYKAALDIADYDKAADAQEKIATAAANKTALERDRQTLEARKAAPEPRNQPQPNITDAFEAAISPYSSRAKDWLRNHRDVVTDPELGAKASWVHQSALKQGIRTDSDEYYQFVEQQLYGDQARTTQTQPRRPMTAAPPSRDAASTTGATSTKIKLSGGEVQSAIDGTIVWNTGPNKGKPIGTQEMARRKALLQKEGAYNRAIS